MQINCVLELAEHCLVGVSNSKYSQITFSVKDGYTAAESRSPELADSTRLNRTGPISIINNRFFQVKTTSLLIIPPGIRQVLKNPQIAIVYHLMRDEKRRYCTTCQ